MINATPNMDFHHGIRRFTITITKTKEDIMNEAMQMLAKKILLFPHKPKM